MDRRLLYNLLVFLTSAVDMIELADLLYTRSTVVMADKLLSR